MMRSPARGTRLIGALQVVVVAICGLGWYAVTLTGGAFSTESDWFQGGFGVIVLAYLGVVAVSGLLLVAGWHGRWFGLVQASLAAVLLVPVAFAAKGTLDGRAPLSYLIPGIVVAGVAVVFARSAWLLSRLGQPS